MKNDDEKLRELFRVKEEPNFDRVIRRAKILSIVRNVIVSLMIFVILSFIVLISNATVLNSMANKEQDIVKNWFDVAMPNAYMGNTQIDDRIMVGEIDYVRYRFLGNKLVTDGDYKASYTYMPLINGVYGDLGNYLFDSTGKTSGELQEANKYNKVGKRVMEFYHPSIKYKRYKNDLDNLNNIDNNKLIELSLSFDKEYSLDEIQAMMPKNVTLNWYWVNNLNKNDIDTLNKNNENVSNEKDKDSSGRIFDENDVFGIKALDKQGNSIKNPEDEFISAIIKGKEKKDYNVMYESLFKNLSNGEGKINRDDLKIIGVVVSGDVETLKGFKDKDYIKAATIGAVSDKY